MEDNKTGNHIEGDKINRQANIEQGNYIEKQIIYKNGIELPRALTTPPFKPDSFIGREKELSDNSLNNVSYKNGLAISYSNLGFFFKVKKEAKKIIKNAFNYGKNSLKNFHPM